MLFKNFDADADKSAQYSAIRDTMAALYLDVDVTLFGQVEIPSLPQNFDELSTGDKVEAKREVKQKKMI